VRGICQENNRKVFDFADLLTYLTAISICQGEKKKEEFVGSFRYLVLSRNLTGIAGVIDYYEIGLFQKHSWVRIFRKTATKIPEREYIKFALTKRKVHPAEVGFVYE
jgi:hypothetical protein